MWKLVKGENYIVSKCWRGWKFGIWLIVGYYIFYFILKYNFVFVKLKIIKCIEFFFVLVK